MSNKLTKKEKGFADEYLATGNGTKSILKNYNTTKETVAGSMANENLQKPKIQAYLEENATGAASRIVEISMKARNEAVKLSANKDILDRAGYIAPQQSPFIQQSILVIMPTEVIKRNALHTNESTIPDSIRPSQV